MNGRLNGRLDGPQTPRSLPRPLAQALAAQAPAAQAPAAQVPAAQVPAAQVPAAQTLGAQVLVLSLLALAGVARAQPPPGSQQLVFAGLRSSAAQGQINAIQVGSTGNLYLLLNQNDGVRVLETDPTATTILAEAHLGGEGDVGLALAIDPDQDLYIAGTSTASALAGTPGAAFPARSGTGTNSFIAKYTRDLDNRFVTFAGGDRLAATAISATADAIFLSGVLLGPTLPVTPGVAGPAFAPGSATNGFVERFLSDGTSLVYATYLSGSGGDTTPAAIAADAQNRLYIAGSTTAPGFPAVAALIPRFPPTASDSFPIAGFLTELAPMADTVIFSTFIPGSGITSLALEPGTHTLLLSGTVDPGAFPITSAQSPLVSTQYQALLRLSLDSSEVLNSTLLAPGSASSVASAPDGSVWITGSLSTPLLPVPALSTTGLAFAAHVNAQGIVDQAARFGGRPIQNPHSASAPITLSSPAVTPGGNPIVAGSFIPSVESSLVRAERFDLPLRNTPTAVLPSSVSDAVPALCRESLCTGSAAYLAELSTQVAAPSLVLSAGASPDVILRNLGSAEATGLQLATEGLSFTTDCTASLPAGGECNIALSAPGPGTLTVSAANAAPATASVLASTASPAPIVFSPHELDFGIVTSTSAPALRVLTVANLGPRQETFASALDDLPSATSPFSQASTTCLPAGPSRSFTLDPGATCQITFALALNPTTPGGTTPDRTTPDRTTPDGTTPDRTTPDSTTQDGPLQANWTVSAAGTRDVLLTGFAQSAALSLSSAKIAFGTRFPKTPATSRFLYLSNNSDASIPHATVALPAGSSFAVVDRCPETLLPHSICGLQIDYKPPAPPSEDSVTLLLDAGLTAPITGEALPDDPDTATPVNPNLSVTPASITFIQPVPVTTPSPTTQTVTLRNTGNAPIPIAVTLTGDFAQTTNCPTTLASSQTCFIHLSFTPTAPGPRNGLLAISTAPGAAATYVSLDGTAAPILPLNNGTLDLGGVPVAQPVVRWFKISEALPHLNLATTGDFRVALVEDIGFGHGIPPPASFATTASGTCLNCFLGVQFQPASAGPRAGTLAITSSSPAAPYLLTLTGTGIPISGPILAPTALDFGTVPTRSASHPHQFALTNLALPPAPISIVSTTITGDFSLSSAVSGGHFCTGNLAFGSTCFVEIAFTPAIAGPATGTLTLQTSAGPAAAVLTGFALPDSGLSLAPNTLLFENTPGTSSTRQSITVTNTGPDTLTLAPPATTSPAFTATGTCATLAPRGTCTLEVAFTPQSAITSGALLLPVTSASGTSQLYTIPLTGAYTSQTAGLQIIPAEITFGPVLIGNTSVTRTLTVNNLTDSSAALTFSMPRQFALTSPNPCTTLAPNTSCDISVTYIPATAADATGTILAQATPADGTPALSAFSYLSGYGVPRGGSSLTVAGPLALGSGVLDFGQLASGDASTLALTLTNSGSLPASLRRVTTAAPFFAASTCLAVLDTGQSCSVAITFSPIDQFASGSASHPAASVTGLLTIESEASNAQLQVDLKGTVVPAAVTNPSNDASAAAYTLSTQSVTFPATTPGSTSPAQSVTLANTGTTTLHLAPMSASASFSAESTCVGPLTPGAICTLSLTFAPRLSGVSTGIVEIASDAPDAIDFITLYGNTPPPALTLSAPSLDFGPVRVGTAASLPLTLANPGAAPFPFGAVLTTPDYTASGDCPHPGDPLGPASVCTLDITFAPHAAGILPGTLSLAAVSGSPPTTVSLTGTGTQPRVEVDPSSLTFGTLTLGASAILTIALANTGTSPLQVQGLSATGDYTVSSQCPANLQPGRSCSALVSFTPAQAGSRTGNLSIQSSAPASPTDIPLSGTGVLPATFTLSIDGGSTGSSTIPSGTLATYTLTITPVASFTGSVALTCTPAVFVPFAACLIAPPSVALAGSPQTATLTINTVANTSSAADAAVSRPGATLLCLLLPSTLVLLLRRRGRSSPIQRLVIAVLSPTLFAAAACGGGPNPNFRYVNPGTYQFQVNATSTGGSHITASVTARLTVTGNQLH